MTSWRSWRRLGPRSLVLRRSGAVLLGAVGARAAAAPAPHPDETVAVRARPAAQHDDFLLGRRSAQLCLRAAGVAGPVRTGANGRPLFPAPVSGSLSHRGGVAVCAIAPRGGAVVGVDLEYLAPTSITAGGHVCAPGDLDWLHAGGPERAPWRLTMLFCAKEALFKAFGASVERPPTYRRMSLRRCSTGFGAQVEPASAGLLPPSMRGPLAVRMLRLDRYLMAWVHIAE